MAVEIDAHAGPVQPRGDLLDMSRLAGAVIAGDDDPSIAGKAGQDGKRGRAVEPVVRIEFGDVLLRFGIGRNLQISIDSEYLSDRNLHVRQAGFSRRISRERHCSSVTSAGPQQGPDVGGPRQRRKKPRRESAVGSAARLHLAESSVAAKATPRSAETSRFQVI